METKSVSSSLLLIFLFSLMMRVKSVNIIKSLQNVYVGDTNMITNTARVTTTVPSTLLARGSDDGDGVMVCLCSLKHVLNLFEPLPLDISLRKEYLAVITLMM